jgi:hypothetical protein
MRIVMFNTEIVTRDVMATAKTGSFYLTETVTIPDTSASGTRVQGVIDLGAYVNVPTGQAIAVEEIDFIWQVGADFSGSANQALGGLGCLNAQVVDLNPGTAFIRADDQSLVASQHIDIDQPNNITSESQDLFPDNFGPASLYEAFMVVNDSMYLVAGNDQSAAADDLYCTVRIRCRVVKLSSKDWMSIAIQSTASDQN